MSQSKAIKNIRELQGDQEEVKKWNESLAVSLSYGRLAENVTTINIKREGLKNQCLHRSLSLWSKYR